MIARAVRHRQAGAHYALLTYQFHDQVGPEATYHRWSGHMELILKHMAAGKGQEQKSFWFSARGQEARNCIEQVCQNINFQTEQNVKDERRGRCMKQLGICLDIAQRSGA